MSRPNTLVIGKRPRRGRAQVISGAVCGARSAGAVCSRGSARVTHRERALPKMNSFGHRVTVALGSGLARRSFVKPRRGPRIQGHMLPETARASRAQSPRLTWGATGDTFAENPLKQLTAAA